MSIQVWSIGFQKLTKMNENHVHIRSTDHFKQVECMENDRNQNKRADGQCVFGCAFA